MRSAEAPFLFVSLLFVAAACRGGPAPEASPPATAAQTPPRATVSPAGAPAAAAKQYDIRGRVEAIARERKTVTLDHEEIPGLMAAMKMDYIVRDASTLEGLAVGDRVHGTLEASDGQYVILTLQKR